VCAEVEIKANSNSAEVVETMWSTCAKYVGLFGFAMSVCGRVGEREVDDQITFGRRYSRLRYGGRSVLGTNTFWRWPEAHIKESLWRMK